MRIRSLGLLCLATALVVDEAQLDVAAVVDAGAATTPAKTLIGLLPLLAPQMAHAAAFKDKVPPAVRRENVDKAATDGLKSSASVAVPLRVDYSRRARYAPIQMMVDDGGENDRAKLDRFWGPEDPEFAAQLQQLAQGDELAAVRKRAKSLERELEAAVEREDYVAAVALRDDLRALQEQDPSLLANNLRGELAEAVREERYSDAARARDQLRVVRTYLPQFQLAGMWKAKFPDGEVMVRFTYDGDDLIATKVSGPTSGQVTFRADVAAVDEKPISDGIQVVTRNGGKFEKDADLELYRGEGLSSSGPNPKYKEGQLYLIDNYLVGFHYLGSSSTGMKGTKGFGSSTGAMDTLERPPEGISDDDGGTFVVFARQGEGREDPSVSIEARESD